LAQETGVALDPKIYIPAVRGYYSLSDGRMASMPFNSSTAMMWYNKDAFEKAGLDPEAPPKTWQDVVIAARTIKEKNAATIPMTTSWPTWIQFEEYSAIHNIPFATKADGFDGLDAELVINTPPFVKHLQRLLDMAKEGTFKYGGRDSAADPLLLSGQAAIAFNSSGERGDLVKSAKFRWGEAFLPYDPEINPKPINSIIGGASLWTMTAPTRTPADYKGVAQLLAFMSTPEQAALWHQNTGYVPVTFAGYELSKQQGFYQKNPGADLPIEQLTRGTVTDNSRGFRLGRMPEIRNIIQEEMENALQGKQGAQQALDNSVTRGNKVLREFEKSVRT
jgi:sn-glycerol 3-phosphate transport system substrate-binding protein